MVIFGLAAAAGSEAAEAEAAGVEDRDDDAGAVFSPSGLCCAGGFVGPASFSIRLFRILFSS